MVISRYSIRKLFIITSRNIVKILLSSYLATYLKKVGKSPTHFYSTELNGELNVSEPICRMAAAAARLFISFMDRTTFVECRVSIFLYHVLVNKAK